MLHPESNTVQYPFMSRLNEQQRKAVEYTDGPSLVVAGAGSGKTTVLTTKIAYLLEQGVAPWNILALTFTNKAAREMRERIEGMVGEPKARSLWMGTFHSIFSRILRKEAHVFGFNSSYTVYQPSDTRSLLKAIIKSRQLDDKTYKPQLLAARISEAKNMLVTPKEYLKNRDAYTRDNLDHIPLAGEIYAEYFNRCHQANAMDFDDMLLYTFIIFDAYPEVRERYAEKFRYILVDEFQDTNYAQFAILNQLTSQHGNICAVGDDAQSIYSFRGARIDNILSFDKVFPNTRIFKLERNYRSTQCIVNAANSLIQKNKNQIRKSIYSENEEGSPLILNELTSDEDEANMLCNRIRTLYKNGIDYSEIAILYRTNGQSDILEEKLAQNNIPYTIYNDLALTERKQYRDFMAYFRFIINPQDEEALKRIINCPARGIGQTTVDKLIKCSQEKGICAWNVVQQPDLYGLDVNNGTKHKLQDFARLIKSFIDDKDRLNAYQLGIRVWGESGLKREALKDISPEGIENKERYDNILNSMDRFVNNKMEEDELFSANLENYLNEVALITNADKDKNGVNLMTVHVAKGLEFDVVFITGLEQGLFPNAQCFTPHEKEEERRLFFVAITRARKRCYLSNAKTRFRHGKTDYYEPSEFLQEIDSKYIYQESSSRNLRQSNVRRNLNEYVDFEVRRPTRRLITSTTTSTESKPVGSAQVQNGVIQPGHRVEHATFGLGTVIRIENNNTGLKAIIRFDNCGEKTLLLKYAKLNIV